MKLRFKTLSMLLAAGATLALTGCKDDMMGDDQLAQEYNGKYLHVRAGIALPGGAGTRSATDDPDDPNSGVTNSDADPDAEYGYDYENEIRTMILLYADAETNNYITHSVVSGITKAPVETPSINYDYLVLAEVKHADLEKAYEPGGVLYQEVTAGQQPQMRKVNVYAFCNYTAKLAENFAGASPETTKNTWLEWTGNITEESSPYGHQPTIQNTIWSQRSFLMTNAKVAQVKFPAELSEWDNYADKSTPWILNDDGTQTQDGTEVAPSPIYVERSAARIDFRDGSRDLAYNVTNNIPANTYPLFLHPQSYGDDNRDDTLDPDDDVEHTGDLNLISIELTRMALVNMSQNFYYIRRTSADGTDNNRTILGKETPTNYVVDTDYSLKNKVTGMTVAQEHDQFNFPLYTKDNNKTVQIGEQVKTLYGYNTNGWYVDKISDVLGNGIKDTWTPTGGTAGRYNIWRYVTENTIPGADNQTTVQSTGIVFKGKIINGKDADNAEARKYLSEDVYNAIKNVNDPQKGQDKSPLLYSFENRLFSQPKDIIKGAIQDGENSALYAAVAAVLAQWKLDGNDYKLGGSGAALTPKVANEILVLETNTTNNIIDLNDANFRTQAPANGINVYEASFEQNENGGEWAYFCYYFYWNRHNDNSKSGLMGPMEFATVRNNVYKLAITSIGRLGHPTNPDDDTDREDPEDPDEPPTNYMKVQVEVLPWVVRVNNIEF